MNEFFSIAEEGQDPNHEFQLKNLGTQLVKFSVTSSRRSGWDREYSSSDFHAPVVKEDYDNQFVSLMLRLRPAYRMPDLLSFHFDYYVQHYGGDKRAFLKHIKYGILPLLRKRKDCGDHHVELVENWLEGSGVPNRQAVPSITNNHITTGNINVPTQFQQGAGSFYQVQDVQRQDMNIDEALELIRQGIRRIEHELKDDLLSEVSNAKKYLDKGKEVSSRLLTVGSLVKDVGISVFANLVASPIYESTKQLFGLK